jgi:hypothetical protein
MEALFDAQVLQFSWKGVYYGQGTGISGEKCTEEQKKSASIVHCSGSK